MGEWVGVYLGNSDEMPKGLCNYDASKRGHHNLFGHEFAEGVVYLWSCHLFHFTFNRWDNYYLKWIIFFLEEDTERERERESESQIPSCRF